MEKKKAVEEEEVEDVYYKMLSVQTATDDSTLYTFNCEEKTWYKIQYV